MDTPDVWFRTTEGLRQQWAFLSATGTHVDVQFVDDSGELTAETSYPSPEGALAALSANGFRRWADDFEAQAFVRPPALPSRQRPGAGEALPPVAGVALHATRWQLPRPLAVVRAADAEDLAHRAAAHVMTELAARPHLLLCAATGSTPTRTYTLLAEEAARNPQAFAHLRVIGLDEWVGVPRTHPVHCAAYLQEQLLGPLRIGGHRAMLFDGHTADPGAEAARVGAWLKREGPIDLAILGLGVNGHLGFIEPADALTPHAHMARLSAQTQAHAMVAGLADPPRSGLTLGIADLLHARQVLLLVSGAHKRAVLSRVLEGSVTTALPASFLHLHPAATIIADAEALGEHAE